VEKFVSDFASRNDQRGDYELFEVKEIGCAYSPTGGHHQVFEEIKIPKGVGRDQRRGQLNLSWSSMFTPNRLPLWSDELQLDIIGDDRNLFKVCNYRWVLN